MGKVEPAAVFVHHGARLLHMGAQHLAQGSLQQMAGGMVAHDGNPALFIHSGFHAVAHVHQAAFHHAQM